MLFVSGEYSCFENFVLASVVLLAVGLAFDSFGLVAPIALSYAFMCLAFWVPIRHFDARGDFSYGTYIYAFPVQQGLVLLGVHRAGFALYFICTVLITLSLAVLSYRFIEAPSLRWKAVLFPRFRNSARSRPERSPAETSVALFPERAK